MKEIIDNTSAANTVLAASPATGTFQSPFTVDIIIDGHGDVFNAAQAKVVVSLNLAIKNLALGDCSFSFFRTPTVGDPSFAGVLLGSAAQKCTVYTLTLLPLKTGAASLSLRSATVRRYGDAADVLSSIQNGSYTLTVKENASPIVLAASTSATPATFSAAVTQVTPIQSDLNLVQVQPQLSFSTIMVVSVAGGIMTLLLLIFATLCFALQQKTPFCMKHERGSLGSERNSR